MCPVLTFTGLPDFYPLPQGLRTINFLINDHVLVEHGPLNYNQFRPKESIPAQVLDGLGSIDWTTSMGRCKQQKTHGIHLRLHMQWDKPVTFIDSQLGIQSQSIQPIHDCAHAEHTPPPEDLPLPHCSSIESWDFWFMIPSLSRVRTVKIMHSAFIIYSFKKTSYVTWCLMNVSESVFYNIMIVDKTKLP